MKKPFEFYGSVTIGERGQVVIPAEARAEIGFQPGDKLLVMRHPVHEGLVFCRLESIREFLDEFYAHLETAAQQPSHESPEAHAARSNR